MKERPILFNGPMVRALLDGSKTQTRRALNPQPVWQPNWGTSIGMNGTWRVGSPAEMGLSERGDRWSATFDEDTRRRYAKEEAYGWGARAGCPYGQPGDRLWVRETHAPQSDCWGAWERSMQYGSRQDSPIIHFAADQGIQPFIEKWRPSIHMPRWASRITLEVVSVRVERLQDISEADAIAEGVRNSLHCPGGRFANENYAHLWWTINGDGSWESNPWVWVIEFKRIAP